ncbi:gamma-glutamyltransferase [Myxacorys almedinensis]|uniref:Glutathione hydrolase proenzyme n=1 Tax=Myxacorys almedinensis A TaxID=2690445 RepID=A0A8J7Z6N7_9CYAN|nr:gamma-glutamyltransferase [Myxacorys almedinensis]NDJ19156.1 gamma-glutamyltransferase [Myxacorys almedinensis A]
MKQFIFSKFFQLTCLSVSTSIVILYPFAIATAIGEAHRAEKISQSPATSASQVPYPFLDRASNGMVASAHPLASQAGLAILQQGGNAIDAAVATTFVISVVEPFSAGIGGGGFMLMYEAKKNETKALDFREKAPLKASRTMYLDAQGKVRPQASINGHLAIAVPGTVAGMYEAHRHAGKLPWKTVIAPAIQIAQSGFPVSKPLANASQERLEILAKDADAKRLFTRNGKPLQVGERLVQQDLAATLRSLSENPNSFYTGKTAAAIAQDMAANGGLITLDDLKQYRPTWRAPVCGNFLKARVCSMPPPSSGGVHLLQMLNLIGVTDLKPVGWHSPDALHLFAESMRIAYADRATYLGDPAFVKVPVAALTNPKYAQIRRREINPTKATPSNQVKAGDPNLIQQLSRESNETSHLTVVDRDRNAVSLTFTVNLRFGAGVVAKGTGILLNNEMDDFAIAPNTPNAFGLVGGEANAIAPKKIPLSSMTPTIVTENGRLRMTVGAPGGSTIITTVLQIVLNVLAYDMTAKKAVAAPRIHHQWLPDKLMIEQWGFDPLTVEALRQRGHQIDESRPSWGNATAIVVQPDGSLEGAADPRGEGIAAGF